MGPNKRRRKRVAKLTKRATSRHDSARILAHIYNLPLREAAFKTATDNASRKLALLAADLSIEHVQLSRSSLFYQK